MSNTKTDDKKTKELKDAKPKVSKSKAKSAEIKVVREPPIPLMNVYTFCKHAKLRKSAAGRLVKEAGGKYYQTRAQWLAIHNKI